MKTWLLVLLSSMVLTQCVYDEAAQPQSGNCSTPATVRDLTGLDGCGFVFELQDGTRLEPYIVFRCGTPPLPANEPIDPIIDFKWVDGKTVFINYEPVPDAVSPCMVGQIVKITCITDAPIPSEDK
jgi:hypothetical protein